MFQIVLLGAHIIADDERVRTGEVGHRAGVELST